MSADDHQHIRDHFANPNRVREYLDIYTAEVTADSTWDTAFGVHRQDLVLRKVIKHLGRDARVLEVGCGIGELTSSFQAHGVDCRGIDQSKAMVSLARERFESKDLPGDLIEHADVFEYQPAQRFDAVIANGVIAYFSDQAAFLTRLKTFLNPGGIIAITHRNALFNIVAFNEGTLDFIADDIFSGADNPLAGAAKDAAAEALPSLMTKKATTSSDDVFRSAENPLTVSALYQGCGLSDPELSYTFIHPATPRFADRNLNGDKVLERSLQMESDWRGMFCGSQFLVVATCP